MVIALGLGIEVARWSGAQVTTQRGADVAAAAGAAVFNGTNSAQQAATAAARLAQYNGASGATSPTWNASTQTLTSGRITAQVGRGLTNSSDTAITVTIVQTLPLWFSSLVSNLTGVTLSATATAEVFSVQPCLLALQTSATSVSLGGSGALDAGNCSIRSDGSIAGGGGTSMTARAFYAAGTISPGTGTITGTQKPSSGVLADPYASYSPVTTAIGHLSPGSGPTIAITGTTSESIGPGPYSSISVSHSASLTLSPGTYYVNGDISIVGNGTLTGSGGVTIVTSGNVTFSNSATITLTAPTTGIPGVVLISTTTGQLAFSGAVAPALTGVVYAPQATLNVSNGASVAASCLEYIVYNATITGGAALSGNCSSLGALSFVSQTNTVSARVVF
jgi:hypothetical protein